MHQHLSKKYPPEKAPVKKISNKKITGRPPDIESLPVHLPAGDRHFVGIFLFKTFSSSGSMVSMVGVHEGN